MDDFTREFGEPICTYTADDAVADGTLIDPAGVTLGVQTPEERATAVKDLADIESMDDYLRTFGRILGQKAIHSLKPLHVPNRDPLPDLSVLGREPFPCQADVIAAAVKMMNNRGSGFIVGEMGTGKTLLGMSACHMHAAQPRGRGGKGGNYRAVVLCPDHLIVKWEREIKETIPGATVTRFGPRSSFDDPKPEAKKRAKGGKTKSKPEPGSRQALRDTLALLERAQPVPFGAKKRWAKPRGAEWYVIGRNQAKWLPDWAGMADSIPDFDDSPVGGPPAAVKNANAVSSRNIVVDKVAATDEAGKTVYGKDGRPVKKAVTTRAHYCPACGTVARNQKGDLLGAGHLSAKGKSASQRRCLGLQMVAQFDPEKPNQARDRRPLPGRFAENAQPGKEVSYGGRKWVVRACNEPLYQYTASPYRWAPARVVQKKLRGFFDYLVVDEVHEHKSDESAQSMACGKLMASARHVLALTGTIIGGYADHLFPLMMRLAPQTLREEGFEWGKDLPFSEVYGKIDRVVTVTEDNPSTSVKGNVKSMRRARSGQAREKKYVRPGIMPPLFGNHLIGTSMFITLEEMADELPDLFEYIGGDADTVLGAAEGDVFTDEMLDALPDGQRAAVDNYRRMKDGWFDTAVDMEPDQRGEYHRVRAILEFANKELLKKGSMKLLGAMLWTLMDYPDRPWGWDHDPEVRKALEAAKEALAAEGDEEGAAKIHLPHTVGFWDKPGDRTAQNWVGVVTPASLDQDKVYPKEQRLIDICKKQKQDGIQTWVYVQMTGKRNVQPRLKMLLEREGLKVGVLRSTDVEPREREEWIAAHGREFDVMLSHPQLVSTGLDLFSKVQGGHNYATIVFYETGYNLFTMRQAARRAWRIGQPRDCRVYYLYYRETMQHKAMSLMSRKMAAAQALEGEFSADGLAAMAGEDNLQMSLAKNLAEGIDDADMQRSWAKIKSGPKKSKKPGAALAEAGKAAPPSPLDELPVEVQMVAETIIEGQGKPAPDAALAEFPGLVDRLAAVDAGFEAVAAAFADDEPSPGLAEGQTGAGLGPFPAFKAMLDAGAARAEAEPAPVLPVALRNSEITERDAEALFRAAEEKAADPAQRQANQTGCPTYGNEAIYFPQPKPEPDPSPALMALARNVWAKERADAEAAAAEASKLKLVGDEPEPDGGEIRFRTVSHDDPIINPSDDEAEPGLIADPAEMPEPQPWPEDDDDEAEYDFFSEDEDDDYQVPDLTPEIMAKMFANMRAAGMAV
jgi:hypothetical protein